MTFKSSALLALVALLILPAAAQARQSLSESGGTIRTTEIGDDGRSLPDDLQLLAQEGNALRFFDRSNPLAVDPNSQTCESQGPAGTGGVLCQNNGAPFVAVVIDLGRGPDRLKGSEAVTVPMDVTGGESSDDITTGAGNDRVDTRDGEADEIDCGAGNDVAVVDRFDSKVVNCETVQGAARSAPSRAKVLKALKGQLGAAATKLRSLFDRNSVSPRLRAPAAGTLTVKLAAGKTAIGTGRKRFAQVGKGAVKVTASQAGKALLKDDVARKVVLRLSFKAAGSKAVTAKRSFTLKPK